MIDILCPVTELSIIIPAVFLAYLPMKKYLPVQPARLALIILPLLLAICAGCGLLCYFFHLKTIWMLLLVAIIALVIYVHSLHITRWKSVSVFLAVLGVFSCLGSIAEVLDVMLHPESSAPWLSLDAAFIYLLLCWISVGIVWYPATHMARTLLEEEAFAQTWYVFWILPLIFIGLNLFMLPLNPEILYQGRLMQIYIIISLVLLCLLLFFYGLFYFVASSLNKNYRLQQENQFLSMQRMQYDNLRTAIAETKRARHDMRHHFNVLSSLTEHREWTELKKYLADAKASLPAVELNLCENHAVDSIISHYGMLCENDHILFSARLDLPQELPVSEVDLCLVLSNLLENALEASLCAEAGERFVRVQAHLHSKTVILVNVENAFDGVIKEKDGVFHSSKRRGSGIGIQSVRSIVEKNGGYSRFRYDGKRFRADVMLRGM